VDSLWCFLSSYQGAGEVLEARVSLETERASALTSDFETVDDTLSEASKAAQEKPKDDPRGSILSIITDVQSIEQGRVAAVSSLATWPCRVAGLGP
jgi:hypothetical protein